MGEDRSERIRRLIEKGVAIRCPESVYVGPEVDLDRISAEGVKIHGGTRISGRETLIMSNAELGREAPVTIENCRIGPSVKLAGGYFSGAVFLARASMKSGAHVREGTILEEGARGAHSVALKQTILFPFVTLGSLINFCDCLMAGGTSPGNHSEVGSSYIHFNYTPNQDKATASLLGDVPRGVMLDQDPIFLGGQGGLVGPRRITFGTVVAAGTICRRDELRPGRLILGGGGQRHRSVPFTAAGINQIHSTVINNVLYIGNLFALRQWYRRVRSLFVGEDFPKPLHAGLLDNIDSIIEERILRFTAFCRIMGTLCTDAEADGAGPVAPVRRGIFNAVQEVLKKQDQAAGGMKPDSRFVAGIEEEIARQGRDYVRVVQALDSRLKEAGIHWLQGIVNRVASEMAAVFPEIRFEGGTDG